MNTLREELNAPLDKVQRTWIRRPVIIILLFPLIFMCILYSFYLVFETIADAAMTTYHTTIKFVKDCW